MMTSPEQARTHLASAQQICVLTGAGISTAAGIPDFRGPQGLWTMDPQAELVSTLSYYLDDEDVRRLAWQRRLAQSLTTYQPTAAHLALLDLHHRGRLAGIITQNTDGLHTAAGIDPQLVHEIHGSAKTCRCEDCGHEQPMAEVLVRVHAGEDDPHCRQPAADLGPQQDASSAHPARLCDGILRATVILFGEPLVPEVVEAAVAAVDRCDLLLAVGSTLAVNPAAALVPYAIGSGARVIIVNNAETEHDDLAHDVVRGDIQQLLPALLS